MYQSTLINSVASTSFAAILPAQQHFQNMYSQLVSQNSSFSNAMVSHIQVNQNLYINCPPHVPPTSAPAFQTLTPNRGVDQSVMIDGKYRLDVTKDGTTESHFKLYDKDGKELAGEWGDPHLTGKNGAPVGDLQCNHVLTLPNGAKIGVRVSKPDGRLPVPGESDVVTELTAVSENGREAMNFNMNVGSSKSTTGTPISGYVGENFIGETLSDHGAFLGAQIGVSHEGGLFDPLTGHSMDSKRLKDIDLMNPDPVDRSRAVNLAMAQDLLGQGYVTPGHHRLYGDKSFASFSNHMRDDCLNGLQTKLAQMTSMSLAGLGCSMRLPNHINGVAAMLSSFGYLPMLDEFTTLNATFNPFMAKFMSEGLACNAIGRYLGQKGIQQVSLESLAKISKDPFAPYIVRNACAFMTHNPKAWERVETNDTGGRNADNWSDYRNFLNRASYLGWN